jgi:hypothetical protein
MSTLSNWIESLLAEFLGLGKQLFDAILPTLKSDSSALIAQVMSIGQQYVVALEANGSLSGAEKQTSAATQITAAAKAAGLNATASIVNTAIELIVQNLNTTKAATPPATT